LTEGIDNFKIYHILTFGRTKKVFFKSFTKIEGVCVTSLGIVFLPQWSLTKFSVLSIYTVVLELFNERIGTYNFQLQVVVVHFGVAVDTDEYGIEAGRNKSEAEYVLGSIRPLIRRISVLHHPSIDAPFIGHGLCNE
jgi:hypothetical protein